MGRDTPLTSSNGQQLAEPAPGTAAAFGAALKAQRNRTRRSLEAVAQRVGLSTSTLSRYERGECLPSEEHVNTICQALGISSQERLRLLGELSQARANPSAAPPKKPSPQRHQPRGVVEAIRHHGSNALRVLVVAFALIGVATTVRYLVSGGQADSRPDDTGSSAAASAPVNPPLPPESADCDRYTVAAADLALRDIDSGPVDQLPREDVVTVSQRVHPRGLPYWEVTTPTGQQGWVDFRYLRPACG